MSGPCLIIFVDTLFEADLAGLDEIDADGVIFTSRKWRIPRRFGVVVEKDGLHHPLYRKARPI